MKILYINPPYGDNFVRSARWAAKSRGRVQRHPEQILIQIAVLEQAGHECCFIEGAALNLSESEINKKIIFFMPQMAIIHTTTPSIYNDLLYVSNVKKLFPKCITVMVGAHATAEPDDTFLNAKNELDIIARGECDYTLKDIAQELPLKNIQGISYFSREDNIIIHNPDRPLLDVNELPFPAWRHIDPKCYHDGVKLYPFLTIYSARGCFGKCTFCREPKVMHGRKLRLRNPQKIVDEIEFDLKLFPFLKEVMFETDTFSASPLHVKQICTEIIKRNINKRIAWSCSVRADMQLNLLPLMKKAGCRMITVGFEFGTNEQLKSVKKGITIDQSQKLAHYAHKLGFIIHGCFMIGAPGETPTSARKTINFAKSLPMDTVQFSGIAVYPGTEMYEWAKKSHYIKARNWSDWVDEKHEQATILSYPQMSKKEIDTYIDKGLSEYYLRPIQILRMLLAIRCWDDIIRKLYGFKKFISYFIKKLR